MCTPQGIIEHLGCMVFDEAVKAVTKAGKYVCHYRTNLENLQREMTTLEVRRKIIEREVKEAHDRGEEIEEDVLQWQTDVDTMKNYVQNLVGQSTDEAQMHCLACSCPSIKWRYRLSKQAEEKIEDVKKLAQESHFDKISHPKPPPPELEFPSAENYVHLDSRTPILEAIVDALKDPNVKMIGIHGLGGVGKTTLVEKVAKKMLDDGTFKQVPLVAVSKVLNVKEIQKKLADKLNLELKATADENAIAIQLWNKFKNGDKYLVILDDIWEEVDLKAIGIPIADGTTGCKVVLTSRKENLLRVTMKADRNFPIAVLSEAEAWDLFKKKVGNTIESRPDTYSLAREVCRNCKGLPVAINALGAALEDRPYHTWKNALDKLERHMLTQIEGIDPSVWASLWVSFDMLRSSDAQSCFLLCCLFAEDAEIPIDELMRHCMARSLLAQTPRTFDEARTAMCTVVDVLKSASLLSTDDHETVVKIHDVIRDVGISIAHKEKAFLVDHGAVRWPRNPKKDPLYSTISISFKDIKELPDGLEYPQLETLMVDNSEFSDIQVPDNFFNGMTQLRVLTITRMRMRQLPSSLAKLKNLQMLYLNKCELDDIAILEDLKSNLEVLSLRGSRIQALPPEIGQLTCLRVLDLQDCDELMVIPRGVTSNLTSLEELYFPENFGKWGATNDEQQDTSSRENFNLEELGRSLKTGKLTTLHIFIPDVILLPKEDLIFVNLRGFKISVGSTFHYSEKEISRRCMLKLQGIQLRNEFIPLVDKAEVVVLCEIEGLKKVFHDRGVGNRFLDLKYLEVKSQPFNNVIVLVIDNCKSKYLFSPTTAKGLVHLEELEVKSCEIMEGIVGYEGGNDKDEFTSEVKFSKLEKLTLDDLPNLLSFYVQKEKTGTTMGSSSVCAQPLFSEKVIFPVLKKLSIEGVHKIIEIWDKQSIAVLEEQGSLCQLTDLDVSECEKLMHVFPSKMHSPLKNLKVLRVSGCQSMEGIVEFEGEIDEDGLRNEGCFSKLSSLSLWNLPNLESFCIKLGKAGTTEGNSTIHALPLFNGKVAFPVLECLLLENLDKITRIWDNQQIMSFSELKNIIVDGCNQLEYVLPLYMLPQLKNLGELEIQHCAKMEVIISNNPKEKEATNNNDTIRFPQLKILVLEDLPNLKSFICSDEPQLLFSNKVTFPVLEYLIFKNIDKITRIWDNQQIMSFSELTEIDVDGCNQLEYVLPLYMLPQLKNLQTLKIRDCAKMEVIISNNPKEKEATNNNDTIRFSQLKTLLLGNLPNLKSFICSDETQLLFPNKVAFPVLEYLHFGNLNKITRIWDNQQIMSFSELEDIIVDGCNQLEYVLPLYMLPQLKNLQTFQILGCRKMEVIISNNPKEKEATNNNDTIRFSQLKTLLLGNLPNLKSFICSDETQLLFPNKVTFPVLEYLIFKNIDKITRIWDNQQIMSFSELTEIDVDGCNQLEYVLPLYMLPQLKNLQTLMIYDCAKMEVIISNNPKEKEATNNNDTIRFPQLKTLLLGNLPNLKSFIRSETHLFFSNKDAFPVLDALTLYPEGTLEFLRNEMASTKEVSMEECGTSGKESDHNGEELDEDLKTPTKEVSIEECSTNGKENDHNGEELDEDLETPEKEVSMEECGTSGKENDHSGEQG